MGAEKVLTDAGVELKIVYMDTKNNPSDEFSRRAALRVKKIIDEFKPDAIISADDNAFKYVIMPYYRDSNLPVVFCGINWDVSIYGAPYPNTTGIIEIGLIEDVYKHLKKFSRGSRMAILAYDSWNERKNAQYAARYIEGGFFCQEYVKDFASWKRKFIELQDKVDMLYIAAPDGIKGWDTKEAEKFVLEHARILLGTDASVAQVPLTLLGLTKIPQEQGECAARMVLDIFGGKKPSEITVVRNKKGDLYLNFKIAEKLNIIFPPAMIRNAKGIIGGKQ
jgi:hypothetical protein